MSSLSEGEHTLKVAFNNGGTATTKFTVAKANTQTIEETTDTTTEKPTETVKSNNPQTGDNIILFIALFVIATLGTCIITKRNKK